MIDPTTAELFSKVAPSLPYVIGVYAALWLGLMGYVAVTFRRLGKLEKQLTLLEDVVSKRG